MPSPTRPPLSSVSLLSQGLAVHSVGPVLAPCRGVPLLTRTTTTTDFGYVVPLAAPVDRTSVTPNCATVGSECRFAPAQNRRVRRERSWSSSDLKQKRETSCASSEISNSLASLMAAKVAWDFVHGASSPTDGGSTRFSSIAPTETDISSLFSDDDVGGSNGSIVNPRKQFDPEALRLAVCAALRNSGSADIYRSACGQESKLDGIRLDLAQAVQEAQNACAAQADIPILTAARDHLLADLARAKELGVPREELAPAELQRRKVHNAIQDLKGQVRVLCRLRPQTPTEKLEDDSEKLRVLGGDCVESPLAGTFFFNGVFAPGTQEGIFDECKDLVQSAVDGHNVTIFSYGQTGAGKTFTMYGTPQAEGLVTRMVDELFNRIDGLQDSYTVAVEGSIAEIYNNRFIDLLNPASRLIERPRLRQGKEGHVHTDDFSKWMVSNGRQLKELIEHGFAQRSVAETVMNTQSSRSHLILTVKLVRTDKATGETRTSKMVFCDLAGSERLKKTEAVGERKKEAIEINKSLAALGDVIEAVAAKRKHVPYRNHTLTRILQDSLGGTAKTLMFVHCSPANSSASETAMSLKFAARAGRIINAECNRQGNCQSRSRSV